MDIDLNQISRFRIFCQRYEKQYLYDKVGSIVLHHKIIEADSKGLLFHLHYDLIHTILGPEDNDYKDIGIIEFTTKLTFIKGETDIIPYNGLGPGNKHDFSSIESYGSQFKTKINWFLWFSNEKDALLFKLTWC